MKKNYISPEINLIKVNTENIMGSLSNTGVGDYKGDKDDLGIGGDIGTWDGTSQPECAKGNEDFFLWDDED